MENNNNIASERNNLTRIVDKESGITISQFDGKLQVEDDSLIPIPNNLASYGSTALQGVPALATNAVNYDTLDRTLYTVTFNGRNGSCGDVY